MKLKNERIQREGKRFFKFLVVGASGAVVDFGVFNLLSGTFLVPVVPASTASFILAVSNNFFWNRIWTYPDSRSKPLTKQAVQFLILNAVGWIIRTPVFVFLEKPWTRFSEQIILPVAASLGSIGSLLLSMGGVTIGRNLALASAILVVLLWNFGANRIWTYSDVK